MFNKDNEKYILSRGLIFVALAYILILSINNYTFFLGLISKAITILKPFFLAALLAYLMRPLVKALENNLKIQRGYCIGIVYLTFIFLIILFINFVIPVLTNSVSQLFKDFPTYLNQLGLFLETLTNNFNLPVSNILNDAMTEIVNLLKNNFTTYLTSAVGTTISAVTVLFNTFIAFAAAFYILLEKESIFNVIKLISTKIFGSKKTNTMSNIISSLHTNIGKYLVGKAINSTFIGVFSFIGLLILKAKYATLLAILLGLTNMIPYVGPIVGSTIAVTLNVFNNPTTALLIVIYLFIIQQIESFVLEPKLIGSKMGVSPLLVIIAVSVGGRLFGLIGMILGVPVMSLIKNCFSNILNNNQAI